MGRSSRAAQRRPKVRRRTAQSACGRDRCRPRHRMHRLKHGLRSDDAIGLLAQANVWALPHVSGIAPNKSRSAKSLQHLNQSLSSELYRFGCPINVICLRWQLVFDRFCKNRAFFGQRFSTCLDNPSLDCLKIRHFTDNAIFQRFSDIFAFPPGAPTRG